MENMPDIVATAEKIVFAEHLRAIAEQDVAELAETRKAQRRKRGQKVIDMLAVWGRSVLYMSPNGCTPAQVYQWMASESSTDPDDFRSGSVH